MMEPQIEKIAALPKPKHDEHWVPIQVIEPSGTRRSGTYDSHYGILAYWKRRGGGWWVGDITGFLVRPHGNTILHEYVDYSQDPQMVHPRTCIACQSNNDRGKET